MQAKERPAAGEGYDNGLRRVRLYDARASCLTYPAGNGVPDHLLAMRAGHTDVKTTEKWYVKPDVVDLLPVAKAWGGLARGSVTDRDR
ncbi:hypothetical protein [Streptomyces sp. NRRL F-5126]|uniref:hypothetical protein n=1 Tax=Streptomyces sp. NRRL F-5126 TaxID=1463857 RepID=UPI0004C94935|nr:hypothetical protein [Streptomyces sp. NRRL F-5126]